MSDIPPRSPPEGAPDQPFTRGRIQWGRPPQTVFRVGPLPRAAAPLTAPSLQKPGPGILSGSMIPPGRPVVEAAAPEAIPDPLPQPEPEPQPEPAPAALRPEQIVEVGPAEPVETVPPLTGQAPPPAEPRSLPSVVVTPTLYATVSAAVETVKPQARWIIVAAVLAVVVTAGFVWLATLPAGEAPPLDLDAPPPPAASAP
jgi:hypothetical protein